jgi:hypothetical protein
MTKCLGTLMSENMIGWYHKDHHIIIFLDHLNFMNEVCFCGTIFDLFFQYFYIMHIMGFLIKIWTSFDVLMHFQYEKFEKCQQQTLKIGTI